MHFITYEFNFFFFNLLFLLLASFKQNDFALEMSSQRLFSARISDLAMQHPLLVTTALFSCLVVVFRHWQHLSNVRERSRSSLAQKSQQQSQSFPHLNQSAVQTRPQSGCEPSCPSRPTSCDSRAVHQM